jgi:hypothetical protein
MPKELSRQRLWQIKHQKAGQCTLCSRKRVTANHCLKHAIASREQQRMRRYNSLTYRLQAKRRNGKNGGRK